MLQPLPGTQRLQREVFQRTKQEVNKQGGQQISCQWRVKKSKDEGQEISSECLYRIEKTTGYKNQDMVVSELKEGNKLMTYLLLL